MEIFFMVFGLGFFMYVMHIIDRDYRRNQDRDLMMTREFGFQNPEEQQSRRLRRKK